tara:strand:- start:67 stop:351 length:285 start_codon:yes stop_codon:yes gene_type:complete
MTKDWKIASTVLISVLIPLGMIAWMVPTGLITPLLHSLVWDLSYWAPSWVVSTITIGLTALWFALPWVGIIWLLLKIWRSKAPKRSPRITEGKG